MCEVRVCEDTWQGRIEELLPALIASRDPLEILRDYTLLRKEVNALMP
jgi:hypothetical protein